MARGFYTTEAKAPRFAGDFCINIRDGYVLSPAEGEYLKAAQRQVELIAGEEAQDIKAGLKPDDLKKKREDRLLKAADLRFKIENGPPPNGKSRRQFFSVDVADEDINGRKYKVNLNITVRGFADPENPMPTELGKLYVAIVAACNIISVVYLQEGKTNRWAPSSAIVAAERQHTAMELLAGYIVKLSGIAQTGLMGGHVDLAKLSLEQLKDEFVLREGNRIKNSYVRQLGFWSAVVAAISLFCWMWIAYSRNEWLTIHRSFLLATAGASIGAWLSFSVRRVNLTFDQLLLVDEHALDPPMRIAFVVGLTLIACLFFWTGSFNIEIGSLKTQPDVFESVGSVGLLIGLLAGLSERALSTAISGRAATFISSIGSGT